MPNDFDFCISSCIFNLSHLSFWEVIKFTRDAVIFNNTTFPTSKQKLRYIVHWKLPSYRAIFFNRSFARSGRMVQNKLCWDANNTRGLPKQRNFYQSSPTFLSFESPTALFTSQYNLFRLLSGQIKDKVITLANHKGHWQSSEPIKTSTKHMSVT